MRHDLSGSGSEDLSEMYGQKVHFDQITFLLQAVQESIGITDVLLFDQCDFEFGMALFKRYHLVR